MSQCSVELWQPLGGVITNIPEAQEKSLSLSVSEGDTFSFTLSGFDSKAGYLNEMITDVVVYRDGDKLFRGRLIQAAQSGDAANCTISCTAVDYKQLLKRRFFNTSGTYTSDTETTAWNAINATQNSRAGASLGITRGVNQATNINVTRYAYEQGTNVKDFIDGLAALNTDVNNGDSFEWTIDADLVFKVFKPTRGKRTPTFLADFGGSVLSYDVQFDPNGYSNVVTVQGNGAYMMRQITDEGRRPPAGGIFEDFISDSQLTSAAMVDARAFWYLTYNGQLETTKTYNLELSSSRWIGPRSCWIGDFIKVNLVHGPLNVQTDNLRITEMQVNFDNSGYEAVAIAVGYAVPIAFKDINRMSSFMRLNRWEILKGRATWYKKMSASLWNQYSAAAKKHGSKSYEAKAAKKRWQDFSKNQKGYNKSVSVK